MARSFRWARPDEGPTVLEVISSAFGWSDHSGQQRQAQRLTDTQSDRFRLVEIDGAVIGAAYIYQVPLYVGQCVVRLGYIGLVSVRRSRQRRGHGSALISDVLTCLRNDGCDVARLSGWVSYYQRFGFVPFPRRFVEFPLKDLVVGPSTVPIEQLLSPNESCGTVRPYDPESHREPCEQLLERFNRFRTGASAEPISGRFHPLHAVDPQPSRFVYESVGNIFGYVDTHLFPVDVSSFEAAVNLYDVAFDLTAPAAVGELIKHVLLRAFKRGAHRATARLPWDPRLLRLLRNARLVTEQVELYNPISGNMLCIVDLERLIHCIEPELSRRWVEQGLSVRGNVSLKIGNDQVSLTLADDKVCVTAGEAQTDMAVGLGQDDFLRLLLGLNPVEQLASAADLDAPARRILGILFPVQSTACQLWG